MSWPMPQDFNESIQNPALAFNDPDLKSSEPVVGPTGLPLPRSGNFADVYQMRGADGRSWAVKCFTRPVTGLDRRYDLIEQALTAAKLPFTIPFQFLNDGIKVRGQAFPTVKMEWVEGLQLNQAVRENAGKPPVLDALLRMWTKLATRLRESQITHADMQHGNVLLIPGSKPGVYGLKLIDYDGMHVPALANQPSGETGHASFQHPQRAAKRVYSPDLDRFPHLIVAAALKGLSVVGASLWERYDTGDNLLFTEEDFQNPAGSALMKELWQVNEPGLRALVGHLARACGRPVPQTPWLDQIAPEGRPIALSFDDARAAATAMGLPPPTGGTRPVVIPAGPAVGDWEEVDEAPAPAPTPTKTSTPSATPKTTTTVSAFEGLSNEPAEPASNIQPRKKKKTEKKEAPEKKKSLLLIAIVAGVLVVGGAIAGGIAAFGGKKKADTAQAPPPSDDGKEKGSRPADKGVIPPVKDDEPKTPEVTPDPMPMRKPVVPVPDPDPKPMDPDPTPVPIPVPVPVPAANWDGKVASINLNTAPPALPMRWQIDTKEKVWARVAGDHVIARDSINPNALLIFDAKTGVAISQFASSGPIGDFQPLPDGTVVSWTQGLATAPVWEPGTRQIQRLVAVGTVPQIRGETEFFTSPDARFVILGFRALGAEKDPSLGGQIRVFDNKLKKDVLTLTVRVPKYCFTADNRLLVADVDRLRWFKLPDGKPDGDIKLPADSIPYINAISPDGNRVLFSRSTTAKLIDTRTGQVEAEFPGRVAVPWSGFSADGRLIPLLVPHVNNQNVQLEVIDLATGKAIGRHMLGDYGRTDMTTAYFTPDTTAVVIGSYKKFIRVIELPQQLVAAPPKNPSPMVVGGFRTLWEADLDSKNRRFMMFDRDSRVVVLATDSTKDPALVFRVADGKPLPEFPSGWGLMPLDKGRIATSENDTSAIIRDAVKGQTIGRVAFPPVPKLVAPPGGGGYGSTKLYLSPDGRFAAASGAGVVPSRDSKRDGYIPGPFRVAEVATGKQVLATEFLDGKVFFSADGSRLLLADTLGRFRWFKLPSGQPDGQFALPMRADFQPESAARVVAVSADGGAILYTGPTPDQPKGGTIAVLDGRTGKVIRDFGSKYYTHLGDVSPDGRMVALIPRSNFNKPDTAFVELFDLAADKSTPITLDGKDIAIPLFSPDGRSLLLRRAAKVVLLDMTPAGVAVTPKPKDPPPAVAGDPLDLKAKWVAPTPGPQVGRAMATTTVVPETNLVLVTNTYDTFAALDLASGQPRPGFTALSKVNPLTVFVLDRSRVATFRFGDNEMQVWNAKTGQADGSTIPIPEPPAGADPKKRPTLSPNGRFQFVGRFVQPSGGVEVPFAIMDATTGKAVVTDRWTGGSVHFTGDSTWVLVADLNGRCRGFKLPSGEPDGEWSLATGAGAQGQHYLTSMSADGKYIGYSGRSSRTPGVLDARTGARIKSFGLEYYSGSQVVISSDGSRAAVLRDTKGADGLHTVEAIDIGTGKSVGRASVRAGNSGVTFTFTPDGKGLLLHDYDGGKLYLFDLPATRP